MTALKDWLTVAFALTIGRSRRICRANWSFPVQVRRIESDRALAVVRWIYR